MASRAIGVDITDGQVRAVQLTESGGTVRVERFGAEPVERDGSAEEGGADPALRALERLLQREEFSTRAAVGLGMPPGTVYFQDHSTDLPELDQVRRVLAFELEEDFPCSIDALVLDVCSARPGPEGRQEFLVGAARREKLLRRVALLEEAGRSSDLVDAEICAAHAAVLQTIPELETKTFAVLYVRGRHLLAGIVEEGSLISVRSLTRPASEPRETAAPGPQECAAAAREIGLMWRESFGAALPPEARLVVGGPAEAAEPLAERLREELPCRSELLEPAAGLAGAEGTQPPPEFALAVGLALRAAGVQGRGMNFLAVEESAGTRAAALRRSLVVFGVLLLLVLVAWSLSLFLRLRQLERENAEVQSRMERIFREALPEEPKIVKPLVQMRSHLEQLRRDYRAFSSITGEGPSPLQVLRQISVKPPPGLSLEVSALSVTGGVARLTGKTDSFKSLDRLKRALQEAPEFREVRIESADAGGGGQGLEFKMAIQLSRT